MIIKCAIIDDEPLALGLLESYVKKTPSLELCGAYGGVSKCAPPFFMHKAPTFTSWGFVIT